MTASGRLWRQHAATNQTPNSGANGHGVRELRPAHEVDRVQARKADRREGEDKKGQSAALAASLTFRPLPLRRSVFARQFIPSQATALDAAANVREALRVRHLAMIVAEALFVQVAEQVKRFHADVRPMELTLHQTPEIFHRVRVDVSRTYSTAWLMTACV